MLPVVSRSSVLRTRPVASSIQNRPSAATSSSVAITRGRAFSRKRISRAAIDLNLTVPLRLNSDRCCSVDLANWSTIVGTLMVRLTHPRFNRALSLRILLTWPLLSLVGLRNNCTKRSLRSRTAFPSTSNTSRYPTHPNALVFESSRSDRSERSSPNAAKRSWTSCRYSSSGDYHRQVPLIPVHVASKALKQQRQGIIDVALFRTGQQQTGTCNHGCDDCRNDSAHLYPGDSLDQLQGRSTLRGSSRSHCRTWSSHEACWSCRLPFIVSRSYCACVSASS